MFITVIYDDDYIHYLLLFIIYWYLYTCIIPGIPWYKNSRAARPARLLIIFFTIWYTRYKKLPVDGRLVSSTCVNQRKEKRLMC